MARKDLIDGLTNGDLKFFICTAPEEEVKKTSWISKKTENQLVIHNVKLKEECSGEEPHFILKSNEELFRFNYCYYYNTKRFYWIKEPPILLPQGQMEIKCLVDPVYSFMLEIGDCMGFEDRSSNIGTGYIQDDEIIFNASPLGKIHEFTNGIGSRAFDSVSYIVSVASNLAYASKFSPGDEPVRDSDYVDYNTVPYDADDKVIIQAIFDYIEDWRKQDYQYSQDYRNSSGYCDCSSMIARAFRDVMNLKDDVLMTGVDSDITTDGQNHYYDTAAAIAYWFILHPTYQKDGPSFGGNTLLLNGHCFENGFKMRPGDLVFFIDKNTGHKNRFPSCWEGHGDHVNDRFDDGSDYMSNIYFWRDMDFTFSNGKDDSGELFYGISHVAIVHDCPCADYNEYDPLVGYVIDNNAKQLKADSSQNAPTFAPSTDGDQLTSMWLLEAVPNKPNAKHPDSYRTITSFIEGTYKTIDCKSLGIKAGNILYQKKNAKVKMEEGYGEYGQFSDSTQNVTQYDFTDDTIAFFIRPDYKKMHQELQKTQQ